VRPLFHNWSIGGSFSIDPEDQELLTLTSLQELWGICGRRIGLGDWRPGPSAGKRPGQYGRFEAKIERAA
jgi:hypothetical protein